MINTQHFDELGSASWVDELRQRAAKRLDDLSPPDPRAEQWRLSDVGHFNPRTYGDSEASLAQRSVPDHASARLAPKGDVGAKVVHTDGVLQTLGTSDQARAQGVIVCGLEQATRQYPGLLSSRLGTLFGGDDDYFASWSLARHIGGTFVYAPANTRLQLPVHSLSWLTGDAAAVHQRTVVVLEEGAELSFVDTYASDEAERPILNAPAVEVFLRRGARLRWLTWQQLGQGMRHHAQLMARLEQDARLDATVASLGASHSRTWEEVCLAGPGASAELLGLTFPDEDQTVEHWTVQHHQAPRTRSDLNFRGALAGNSRSVYTGTIRVDQGAPGTDAYQKNSNLLLSKKARADTNPQLEIQTDDVRCTHGATCGPLQQEQLFYLMSRGIPETEARRLVVQGFFQSVIQQLDWSGMETALGQAVQQKLSAIR